MSESETGPGQGVSAPVFHAPSAQERSLFARLAARWWMIVGSVLAAAAVGLIILATSRSIYAARCILLMETAGAASSVPPDEFLGAQRELVLSAGALSAAREASAMQQLDEATDVRLSVGEGLMIITVRADDAQLAARGANALTDVYLKSRADQQSRSNASLSQLTAQRDAKAAIRSRTEQALKAFREESGSAGGEAERAVVARLEQLSGALTSAQLELANATATAAAGHAMLADPVKVAQIVESNRSKGIFSGLDQQKAQLENELQQAQAQLELQKKTMLPQHPKVIETQRRIESLETRLESIRKQYGQVYATWVDHQRLTAQRKVEELQQLVDQQSKQNREIVARSARLRELESSFKAAQDDLDALDNRIRDAKLTDGPAGATMRIVQSARPPARPSSPDRVKIMTVALLVGLCAGAALAGIGRSRR